MTTTYEGGGKKRLTKKRACDTGGKILAKKWERQGEFCMEEFVNFQQLSPPSLRKSENSLRSSSSFYTFGFVTNKKE
jgi:hypothetical protein